MFPTMIFSTLFFAFSLAAAEVPVGAEFTVRMVDGVDSSRDAAGQTFRGTLDQPLLGADGSVVVEKGAPVRIRLDEVEEAGRLRGRPMLALVLVSVKEVQVSSYRAVTSGGSRLKSTAAVVGGATAAGALLGGGVGAAAGAGAGTAFQLVKRGKSLKIPSESLIRFKLAYATSL